MHELSSAYYLDNHQKTLELEEYKNKSLGEIYLDRIKFIKGNKSTLLISSQEAIIVLVL